MSEAKVGIRSRSWVFVGTVVVGSLLLAMGGTTEAGETNVADRAIATRDMEQTREDRLLNATIGDFRLFRRSATYLLAQILLRCRAANPGVTVHAVLWYRDRRIVERPETRILTDESLLNADTSGDIDLVLNDVPLGVALRCLSQAERLEHQVISRGYEVCLHVGPPELISGDCERSTFKVTDGFRGRVESLGLPGALPVGGPCMAYDPEKGFLVIIEGKRDLPASTLARAIGERVHTDNTVVTNDVGGHVCSALNPASDGDQERLGDGLGRDTQVGVGAL